MNVDMGFASSAPTREPELHSIPRDDCCFVLGHLSSLLMVPLSSQTTSPPLRERWPSPCWLHMHSWMSSVTSPVVFLIVFCIFFEFPFSLISLYHIKSKYREMPIYLHYKVFGELAILCPGASEF